jgi:hypothetical protein
VSDWVWCPSRPEDRLLVWAVLDGVEVAAAVADLPRPSLVGAGIGDGRHGFRLKLPEEVDEPCTLAVETAAGQVLPLAAGYASDVPAAYAAEPV